MARVVIGVLVIAAALTAYFGISPDDPADRRDVLLLIGLIGGGAALAASALPKE